MVVWIGCFSLSKVAGASGQGFKVLWCVDVVNSKLIHLKIPLKLGLGKMHWNGHGTYCGLNV